MNYASQATGDYVYTSEKFSDEVVVIGPFIRAEVSASASSVRPTQQPEVPSVGSEGAEQSTDMGAFDIAVPRALAELAAAQRLLALWRSKPCLPTQVFLARTTSLADLKGVASKGDLASRPYIALHVMGRIAEIIEGARLAAMAAAQNYRQWVEIAIAVRPEGPLPNAPSRFRRDPLFCDEPPIDLADIVDRREVAESLLAEV